MTTTTALIGLLGVMLGTVLGGLLQLITDRRRWRREDRQRWHDRRLTAYATTVDRLPRVFTAFGSSVQVARPLIQSPMTPLLIRRRMKAAEPALLEARGALLLIKFVGDRPSVAAAEKCLDILRELAEELATWSRARPADLFDDKLRERCTLPASN